MYAPNDSTPILKHTVFTEPGEMLKIMDTTTKPRFDHNDTYMALMSGTRMTFLKGNPTFSAPRMCFQWFWFNKISLSMNGSRPQVLNIGCADDPTYFGSSALHYDMDDWSAVHDWFQQGDAADLPFEDQSFELTMMGDIHEHMAAPLEGSLESARVSSKYVVWSIFEELRLPEPGQHIALGQRHSDEASQRDGYEDRFDAQAKISPERIGVPDDLDTPHLSHINRLTDQDIDEYIEAVLPLGFELLVAAKLLEVSSELKTLGRHHDWWNWLVAFERVGAE